MSPQSSVPALPLIDGRFRALLFDCDGTLADTAELHHFSLSTAIRELGHEMPKQWYLARVGLSLDPLLREFQEHCGEALAPEAVQPLQEDVFCKSVQKVRGINSVIDIAKEYAGKVPLAVVSGSSRRMVRATLEALDIHNLFSAVITVESVTRPKPAPDAYLEAARLLGVPPESCLAFEDSDQGLEAARLARMTTCDVRTMQ